MHLASEIGANFAKHEAKALSKLWLHQSAFSFTYNLQIENVELSALLQYPFSYNTETSQKEFWDLTWSDDVTQEVRFLSTFATTTNFISKHSWSVYW